MSAQEERDALDLPPAPPALYDHARALLRECPDGLPPRRGLSVRRRDAAREPLPDGSPPGEPLTREAAGDALRQALDPLPDDSAELHRRFARLGIDLTHRRYVRSAVLALPLPDGQRAAALALARQLTRTGTTVPAVTAGLALLIRLGEPEDVPYLRVLGLVRELTGPALEALERLDRQGAATVRLVVFLGHGELRPLARVLWTDDRSAVRTALLAVPADGDCPAASAARWIAEAVRLDELIDRHPDDLGLLARAGWLLARIGRSRYDLTELLAYPAAVEVYGVVVAWAGLLPPTLDNAAMLLSLALDLGSGTGVLLDWPPGRREELLASLGRLLAEPGWADVGADATDPRRRRRAEWFHRVRRRPFERPAGGVGLRVEGLRIEVVAGDPADRGPVETRLLVDGRPVVPAYFGLGPARRPEELLDEGGLRATDEPREVELAEASCTAGCCGSLHVTIRRDGDQVVWENWRWPNAPASRIPDPLPPAHRFDARAYDAEVARAEADTQWCWRARSVARLVKAGLIERPELLSRWDASRGWISSGHDDPDTAVVHFWYVPGLASGRPERPDSPLQFRWDLPDDGRPPEVQAAAALRRLAEEDPKAYSRVSAGSRERAEELGYAWSYDS
ncbi:hypothetical protein ACWEQL_00740 [Kitasatospora sp. NPDC004240]